MDNLTVAVIFLNTLVIEMFVSSMYFTKPEPLNLFDLTIFMVAVYVCAKQLTKKGVFLLNEKFEFVVFRMILPLFILEAILKISYFWLSCILVGFTIYRMEL